MKSETGLQYVKELAKANQRTAIYACLEMIYEEAIRQKPKLIVELGVSDLGLSTKVLSKVAEIFDAEHISIDHVNYCDASNYGKWRFVKSDDIRFSKGFVDFCSLLLIDPMIDLLFIDTDELYDHVRAEIDAYFPFLSRKATVMFRCTNLQHRLIYKDGSVTHYGWDNKRGVIRAIKDKLEITFDETKEYEGIQGMWHVKHIPWGAGLTVLRKAGDS